MKGTSFMIWSVIIFASAYITISYIRDFDIDKVDPSVKQLVQPSASSTLDILNGIASSTENTDYDTASTTKSGVEVKKDPKLFNFDGEYYKKADLPVDFKKIFTPTGSIYVKISDSEPERVQGLSGVSEMDLDVGMLFIFSKSEVRNFWMKDMNFPIDIVWIDENKKVIGVSENVLVESYPNSISSVVPARYVLEINAFMAKKIGLKAGAKVVF